ncbi:type IV secretory system conjugative DNA transfer family protein [Kibdelosporangium aridum]|uniref:type IV secretory system conjugative DNA transfer family protein n=1 Tax=Kibdelosporangium aridum TaxID=2030 RepID=UPI00052435AE
MNTWMMATAVIALASSILLLIGRAARVWWHHHRMHHQARVITIKSPPTVDPAGAITLWSNMIGTLRPWWARLLIGQPHLAFEYCFHHDTMTIQLWVPGTIPPGLVDRAITAAWPGASTTAEPVPSRPISGRAVGGTLRLGRHEALPLQTDFTHDPLRPLIGAAGGLGPDDRACLQILARPATGRRITMARNAARHIRTGQSSNPIARMLDSLSGATPTHVPTRGQDPQGTLEHSAQDRAIIAKQRGPQFETVIRYTVSTTQRQGSRTHLRGRAHSIAAAMAAFSEYNYLQRRRLVRPTAVLNRRLLWRGDLLSVPELAALAHVPFDAATPGLQRANAKAVAPPAVVATSGPGIKPIGIADTGQARPVGLKVADARHHLHILGATGSGKSELMARMILADADAGRGLVVIDPKGDLIDDILQRLPARFADRVVLLDSDGTAAPPVLNPLDGPDTASTVDNLVSIFARVYASSWGPRTDDLLRSGLLTLRALSSTPTLLELPTLLTVAEFRQRARATIDDEILAGFWTWYDELSDASRAQVAAPLMNKLRGLLLRPFVRATLTGAQSTLDMDSVLDGGICLVRLAKGTLSTDTVRLVGSIVVARTWQAATRRSQLPKHRRRDCALYLDEFQNFLNLAYPPEEMLPEARAYGLSLVLAHHNQRQTSPELQEAMSVNARNKIILNASPEDARRLAHHTAPHITDHDLANLGRFQAAVRLVVDSEDTPAFTARTEQLPPAIPGRAEHIRRIATANTQPTKPVVPKPKPGTDPRRAAA